MYAAIESAIRSATEAASIEELSGPALQARVFMAAFDVAMALRAQPNPVIPDVPQTVEPMPPPEPVVQDPEKPAAPAEPQANEEPK